MTWERQLTNVALKPSCHEQGRREMESSAERREEAFELMKFSRYLHKSGMNRLPEQQDQSPAVREGLAKIDGNMVRYVQQTTWLPCKYICIQLYTAVIRHHEGHASAK